MEDSTMLISVLIEKAKSHLNRAEYHESTIQRYRSVWNKLLQRCNTEGILYYSFDVCASVIRSVCKFPKSGKLTHYQTFCIRAVKMLDDIHKQVGIQRCNQPDGVRVVDCFYYALDAYLKSQETTEKTVRGKSIQMTRFLNYLYKQGLSDLSLLTADTVLSYIKELQGIYTRNTVSGILFTLRNFLLFLYDSKINVNPLHQLFPVIFSNKLDRLPSYYHENEIKKILTSVNRDTSIGKRDYLILLFAVQLGIRAGDIRMMKLECF